MSMTSCRLCSAYIDTDCDPGCYVDIGNMKRLIKEVAICESCREEQAMDNAAMEMFSELWGERRQ